MDYIERVDWIETLLKEWHEAGRAAFERSHEKLNYDSPAYLKTAKYKTKYIYLDDGSSGAFMVDRSTNQVFCVKAYGIINRRKCIGELTTLTGEKLNRYR